MLAALVALIALLALSMVPGAAAAQAGRPGAAAGAGVTVAGSVVDATTGVPMAGATVVIEPDAVGAFPGSAAGSGFSAAARRTATDGDGRYRFQGLAPGPYRLYATHYGYRPYAIALELGGRGAAVSVGLEAEPIALEPVRATTRSRALYVSADPFGPDADLGRLLVADLRRRRYLSTDVRELTHADVVEAVTLGEPDLFRALQRLPGVTTRSDYTAAIWTRGAPWSQTRVYYDGLPLFNPLHALGMISGIGSSAVGTVWFHPGVRSAAIAEGAAGVVDVRSRSAAGTGGVNVQADASLATAGVALDQRVMDGRAGWVLTGRSSYLDWLTDLARRAAGRDDETFPYSFTETSGRLDARLSDRHAVEASWLWEGDQLSSPEGEPDPVRADWGNAVARATWSAKVGGYEVQHTLGRSAHHGMVRDNDARDLATSDALRRSETTVGYTALRGALWPSARPLAGPAWTAGYDLARYDIEYFGPTPLPVPDLEASAHDEGGDPVPVTPVSWRSDLPVFGVWGERLWAPTGTVGIRTGLRLEAGGEIRDEIPVRIAPRLEVRYSPAPELAISAGLARVHQYAQTVAPGGVQLASLGSSDAWLLAGPNVPALRSSIATVGVETWLAADRLVTINVFGRITEGVVSPNPTPGPIVGRSPTLVVGQGRATGLEVSVRQLAGPVTGTVSYTLSRARTEAAGREYPSGADRTHVVDLTAMVAPAPALRLGAAFTAATGVPYTRAVSDPADCAREPACDPAATLPWGGEPNATRAPAYVSLDLLADWSREVAGLHVGVYAQIRNVLGRENATVYAGDASGCLAVGCSTDELRNAYERGVPRLPVIGIRVRH